MKLEEAKHVSTPGTREEGRTNEDNGTVLSDKEATSYRAPVARCNHLAPDRPDIAFSVKELAKAMSKPIVRDMQRLKRLARYLKGKPRLVSLFNWQPMQTIIVTYSDADWAGCRDTRRSTTGGCVTIGSHSIKSWSKTQSLIALSPGESELFASLKASAEILGILAMLKDLGWKLHGEIWGDANAALGITNRKRLGKTRHIDTGLVWVQQVAAEQRLKYQKVLGADNPADLFTKYIDERTIKHHVTNLGYRTAEGRAEEAPQLQSLSVSLDEYLNGNNWKDWEWLQYLQGVKAIRERTNRESVCVGDVNILISQITTNVWRQVLQGINWQVQGTNGSNSARPVQPWGSTLTFQPRAGVSYGTGVKHWVTMHPRGRHLREGMILPPHGVTQQTAREQQSITTQVYNNHQWPSSLEEWFKEWDNSNGYWMRTTSRELRRFVPVAWQHNYNRWWEAWNKKRNRDEGTGPNGEHQDLVSEWCHRGLASPARRQPGELYCNVEVWNLVNPNMKLGRRRNARRNMREPAESLGGHRATWCRGVTRISTSSS